jgi:hypothetical protein
MNKRLIIDLVVMFFLTSFSSEAATNISDNVFINVTTNGSVPVIIISYIVPDDAINVGLEYTIDLQKTFQLMPSNTILDKGLEDGIYYWALSRTRIDSLSNYESRFFRAFAIVP